MNTLSYQHSEDFLPLPVAKTQEGRPRLCGFEFEYTGVPIERCAELLAQHFCGDLRRENDLTFRVQDTAMGNLKIEADWRFARKIAEKDLSGLPGPLKSFIQKSVKQYSEFPTLFIPSEIVTEPLREEQFGRLEQMRELLLKHKAKGTSESFSFAFGTHINCEVPSTSLETALDYLRAFLIAYPSLVKELNVNPTRRLLSFIDPFPKEYAILVLDPEYRPGWETFIRDYIRFNNTRNRALDLFPLIVHLFPDMKEQISQSCRSLVKPRPAFHYRLPDCEFGDSGWRVAGTWNSWVFVERLAADQNRLAEMSRQRHYELCHPFRARLYNWADAVQRLLGK